MNYDKNWVFQDNVSVTGVGNQLYPNRNDSVTISITGTSTSRNINFEGSDSDGNWTPIMGIRLSDYTSATSTTGNNEKWMIDLTGLVGFRTNVTAVAGGYLRVLGKVVNSNG